MGILCTPICKFVIVYGVCIHIRNCTFIFTYTLWHNYIICFLNKIIIYKKDHLY